MRTPALMLMAVTCLVMAESTVQAAVDSASYSFGTVGEGGIAVVPEPSTALLSGLGFTALAAVRGE